MVFLLLVMPAELFAESEERKVIARTERDSLIVDETLLSYL